MSLERSLSERRADRFTYRRSTHVDKNPAFRLAGRIFADTDYRSEKSKQIRESLQRSRPVGFGFGTRDEYGPDNSWESQDSLRGIHDRDHYIVGENHGFGPHNY
jgi:hypothetical protein